MAVVYDKQHIAALKRAEELVGPLSPVLREKGSNLILSGRNRKAIKADWFEMEKEVKDPLHRELIILLSNVQRQPSEEELKFRLNRVASSMTTVMQIPDESVCDELCKMLSPDIYSERRIQQLLDDRWKQKTCPKKPKKTESVSVSPEPSNLKKQFVEIKEKSTALDAATFSEEDPRPFPNCTCNKCEHFKKDCY